MDLQELAPLIQLSVFDLYDLVTGLAEDPERSIPEEELDAIRWGITTEFDLLTIKDGNFTTKHKANGIIINGERLSLSEFNGEMQKRKSKAVGVLLLALEQKDILKSR